MKRFAPYAGPAFLSTLLLGMAISPVKAQTARMNMLCGDRSAIVGTLTNRYGEQVQSMGLAHQNRIVEVYVSAETGTWTIAMTSADGTTCLMAAGQHFALMPPVIPGDDL